MKPGLPALNIATRSLLGRLTKLVELFLRLPREAGTQLRLCLKTGYWRIVMRLGQGLLSFQLGLYRLGFEGFDELCLKIGI